MTSSSFIQSRVSDLRTTVARLLDSTQMRFDSSLRGLLPDRHGIYRIFLASDPAATLRAGRTKSAAGGLRQRVYQNHFMGDQQGNLRQQLVSAQMCRDMQHTKQFIRSYCLVQIVEIEKEDERKWAEHFMLSVLRPTFTD